MLKFGTYLSPTRALLYYSFLSYQEAEPSKWLIHSFTTPFNKQNNITIFQVYKRIRFIKMLMSKAAYEYEFQPDHFDSINRLYNTASMEYFWRLQNFNQTYKLEASHIIKETREFVQNLFQAEIAATLTTREANKIIEITIEFLKSFIKAETATAATALEVSNIEKAIDLLQCLSKAVAVPTANVVHNNESSSTSQSLPATTQKYYLTFLNQATAYEKMLSLYHTISNEKKWHMTLPIDPIPTKADEEEIDRLIEVLGKALILTQEIAKILNTKIKQLSEKSNYRLVEWKERQKKGARLESFSKPRKDFQKPSTLGQYTAVRKYPAAVKKTVDMRENHAVKESAESKPTRPIVSCHNQHRYFKLIKTKPKPCRSYTASHFYRVPRVVEQPTEGNTGPHKPTSRSTTYCRL